MQYHKKIIKENYYTIFRFLVQIFNDKHDINI